MRVRVVFGWCSCTCSATETFTFVYDNYSTLPVCSERTLSSTYLLLLHRVYGGCHRTVCFFGEEFVYRCSWWCLYLKVTFLLKFICLNVTSDFLQTLPPPLSHIPRLLPPPTPLMFSLLVGDMNLIRPEAHQWMRGPQPTVLVLVWQAQTKTGVTVFETCRHYFVQVLCEVQGFLFCFDLIFFCWERQNKICLW